MLRSELFPTEIRATSAGIIMALGNLTAMVNLKLFTIAVELLGFHVVTYFYAAVIGVMVAWGFLTIKNNDRLSLTEIQDMQQKTESLERNNSSSDKEVNSRTDEGHSSDVNVVRSKEENGHFALSILSERNCYVNPIEINDVEGSTNQNEIENKKEDQDSGKTEESRNANS